MDLPFVLLTTSHFVWSESQSSQSSPQSDSLGKISNIFSNQNIDGVDTDLVKNEELKDYF